MTAFVNRHIGVSAEDQSQMLELLGYPDLESLLAAAMPEAIRSKTPLNFGQGLSEPEVLALLKELAKQNRPARTLIGQGYYGTHTPTPIARNVLENPAWYTAYTPYQPEISQGRLEAMLNFQTMVAELTGLHIAGASLLDEATAAAEAMALMARNCKHEAAVFVVDELTHPQTKTVLQTRAKPMGWSLRFADLTKPLNLDGAFGVLISHPATDGSLRDLSAIVDQIHEAGLLVAFATDLLFSCISKPAGEWGADIAVGSAQRFGVPLGFGGPHAGFMAVRAGLERSLPGRLVGVSIDSAGNPAYRLSLQTREQHIRREKATSNICTAQALLAVMASMYAVYHGPVGLRDIALRISGLANGVVAGFKEAGIPVRSTDCFDTVAFMPAGGAVTGLEIALQAGFNLRQLDAEWLSLSVDETVTADELSELLSAYGATLEVGGSHVFAPRTTTFLTHPVFNSHHSETALMRYLRRLADFDLALDRTMIPLGSCTMKLNAATEMAAITWPEFADVHPFVPENQAEGWLRLIAELEADLATLTGYDKVSIQPNAGSQGEFAGLLAISNFHAARGESHRNICLIPSSAHGTNAASAVMAGMKVVVVACDENGNVDVLDLQAKISEYADSLAAIMVTYPSTHGVYEDTISEVCELVHAAGGQVYVDGANLNALVGLAQPGKFGADVSHLNLHKTFAIPHGGGGPGVGPVAVRSHLAEYLPGHPMEISSGAVSAAPFGSAGVLPISYAYIRLMGGSGLKSATEVAVLSANYLARKIGERFPVLYANEKGLVAHECILDLRDITKASGVTVDDVAKRLVDYGFHSPTMSFPVAGTLMVEPTESEPIWELDRFVEAMCSIADEIDEIEGGRVNLDTSALRQSPHTAHWLVSSNLSGEERAQRAFPGQMDPSSKYWPPVGRIDGAYGDRNLVCSCPSPAELAEN